MNIAIIPARGGSKRIPKKNIKEFCGKPMIAYSIEAALQSGCFDKVIVSTDDQEIAVIAQSYGAEVPFVRPDDISDDFTTASQVIVHAIKWLERQNLDAELVCCIYATAPFISKSDLSLGYSKLIIDEEVNFVFSAALFSFSIHRAIEISQKGEVTMLNAQHAATRSQDLPDAYHDAGQFYWGRKSAFLDRKEIFANHSRIVLVPRERVQDIDTPADWQFAEVLFRAMNSRIDK
jgi:pseudaminic acid cytidylyltransferase